MVKLSKIRIIIFLFTILIFIDKLVIAYNVETPNQTVHQYLTNESQVIWELIPYEIKEKLKSSTLEASNRNQVFNNGDGIINGSAEEDYLTLPTLHFWQPDNPTQAIGYADYDDGLATRQSSYRHALEIWTQQVVPLYLKGQINESYYHLGRVAHLLEDSTQPSHIHLDAHLGHNLFSVACLFSEDCDDSVLEEYTGDNFQSLRTTYNWTGSNFIGQQYNYENLPNMSAFNWKEVEPNVPLDRRNIELFRLFWYTAQKTQHFASDDVDGNSVYVNISGATKNFPTPLWDEQNVRIINRSAYLVQDEITNNGPNVSAESNAMIPHAMKAVAGLYRLFDDAVRIDWPTENHDFRRTGFTLLKGDLVNKSDVKNQVNFVLDDVTGTEQVVKAVVADLDNNNFMDSVVLLHKTTYNTYTKMYGIENQKIKLPYTTIKRNNVQKWPVQQINGGAIYFPATLANIDSDSRKEIITGTRNGTIYAYDVNADGTISQKWVYYLEPRFSAISGDNRLNFNGGNAVADLDLDGNNEVIFADLYDNIGDATWNGKVYVLDGNTEANLTSYNVGNGGTYASVSVANVDDSDDNPEIIVPTLYGIVVLDYDTSTKSLTEKCSNNHGLIEGSAVISDVDNCVFGGVVL